MYYIMILSVFILTGCLGPKATKVNEYQRTAQQTKVQLKVLDLLIAKENNSMPRVETKAKTKAKAEVQRLKPTGLTKGEEETKIELEHKKPTTEISIVGEDEYGNQSLYTFTGESLRKLNEARSPDDSAGRPSANQVPDEGIEALKEISLTLIKSSARMDPALAKLLWSTRNHEATGIMP